MAYKPMDSRLLVRPSEGSRVATKLFGSKHNSAQPTVGGPLRSGTVVSVGKPRYKDQEPIGVKAGDEVVWRGGEDIELNDEKLVLVDSYELLLKETD